MEANYGNLGNVLFQIPPDARKNGSTRIRSFFSATLKGACKMLVLSRKVGESIEIAGGIRVTVSEVKGGRVRLSIQAPPEVRVLRKEIADSGESARSRSTTPGSNQ